MAERVWSWGLERDGEYSILCDRDWIASLDVNAGAYSREFARETAQFIVDALNEKEQRLAASDHDAAGEPDDPGGNDLTKP